MHDCSRNSSDRSPHSRRSSACTTGSTAAAISPGSARELLDIDELPRPDRSVLSERYYTDYGIESLQTKRGCPLHCEYCTYPLIEGGAAACAIPAKVANEFMELCARKDVAHVFIVDSVFNLPLRHAKDVCRELVARGNRTPWTSYVNPVAFDDELAELMVQAGAAGMEIGSDSGCDEVLDRLRKGFRTDKITARSRAIAKAHGLKDCHSFILGTTARHCDDVERTLDFVEELDPFAALMLVWVDDQEVVDPRSELERRHFRDEIYARIGRRAARQPRWSVPSSASASTRGPSPCCAIRAARAALAAPRPHADPQVRRAWRPGPAIPRHRPSLQLDDRPLERNAGHRGAGTALELCLAAEGLLLVVALDADDGVTANASARWWNDSNADRKAHSHASLSDLLNAFVFLFD